MVETIAAHKITRSQRVYILEELSNVTYKKSAKKQPITEDEDEKYRRRIQSKEYSIVKHSTKIPTQIFF